MCVCVPCARSGVNWYVSVPLRSSNRMDVPPHPAGKAHWTGLERTLRVVVLERWPLPMCCCGLMLVLLPMGWCGLGLAGVAEHPDPQIPTHCLGTGWSGALPIKVAACFGVDVEK